MFVVLWKMSRKRIAFNDVYDTREEAEYDARERREECPGEVYVVVECVPTDPRGWDCLG